MSTLSWNCRGLGNPRTVREVVDLVSRKKPEFVFLMETKVGRLHAERLRVKLGFEGLFYVDNVGLSGGSASWDLLRTLANNSTLPWVVLGDFNDLLFQHEKRGGNPHPDNLLRGFGEAVDDCVLVQLPMQGYQFTWERGRGSEEWMEEGLDKVLARADWCSSLPEASVSNILTRTSDHSALFLGVKGCERFGGSSGKRFKFEMAWVHDEGCREQRYQHLETVLCQLETHEDAFWRQRAKQHWLRGADANTKFFHRYASTRKKKNTITRLKNDLGVWVEHDELNDVVLNYFHDIFASNVSTTNLDSFTASITPRVTQEHNTALLRPFELEEVKAALLSMFPDKAPGPDGMNPGFYQHYWDVVGGDVSAFVLNCLNSSSFPPGLNDTNVVLIPKKHHPELVFDLRPIALCNVVYKIMAKMVANRMKPFLGEIISNSQSAFIPNRLITDNILIAAEVGHFLNRKHCGVMGWGALKLDMAKAYDRMEWAFLRRMLLALGFAEEWVNLVMLCATTVSYNFLVNGNAVGQVVPTRGIRQGDPLSPYLFIICAEGLSLLLQQAESRGAIHGCRVARGAPPISHLFFADDSLLFFRANAEEAGVIKQCLTDYESMTGQLVNFHKSSVCFSRNTTVADRDVVASILGVLQAPNFGKYLGLPSFIGREKRAVFSYIEDKVKQRISSWTKKLISQAGKEVLLKSVAQSMPTFSMSVFLLPDSVCSSIERTMNKYWWGTGNERGIHWKAWDRLYIPKKFGGLGFKDLRAFNLFLLEEHHGCHELICSGVRRRIGDGKYTLIWGHPWLPDDPSPMVQTPMPGALNGSLDIFSAPNVERIMSVPVSPHHEDSWFWLADPKGCYPVKEGYRRVMGEYEISPGAYDKWLQLWKIKCPAKWKIFVWRALSNVLPTTTNLILKRVEIDPTCPISDVLHLEGSKSRYLDSYLPASARVWREADSAAAAWRSTHSQQIPPQPPMPLPLPLPTGEHRCFIDASFRPQTKTASVGAVLLAHDGGFIAGLSARFPAFFSPLMAESLACKEALSWLKNRGLSTVHIFTDCSTLRDLLNSPHSELLSYVGYSIDAARTLMSSFISCLIHLVPRSHNKAAHTLAAEAFSHETPLYCDLIPPNSIAHLF
ncbi:uncharacterized protein LOC116009862 [Ipomoea triloba]|uniref:uncharacterized protein LOC116009862 n=1 Tax=Ipomoea triloba TaxID=35885 RepID=UPI00125E0325|nr:uncharacterized protein LOC116009862 [Ipomoea triloba]